MRAKNETGKQTNRGRKSAFPERAAENASADATFDSEESRRLNAFLGERIRDLRKERKWNLNELSQRIGVAPSTLSKVENNLLSLNYDRLVMVARAFELTLSEFLAGADSGDQNLSLAGRYSLAKRDGGKIIKTPNYFYHYLCTNLKIKKMVPILAQVKARTLKEFGPFLRHEGEEFSFVFKGKVIIHTEMYEPETLDTYEGVYIDSRMGHAYLNGGEGEAWVISVNTNPLTF